MTPRSSAAIARHRTSAFQWNPQIFHRTFTSNNNGLHLLFIPDSETYEREAIQANIRVSDRNCKIFANAIRRVLQSVEPWSSVS